jgi:hypothetical protein
MNKSTIITILVAISLLAGCALLPAKPAEVIGGGTTENVQPAATQTAPAPQPAPQPTEPAQSAEAQAPEPKYTPAVPEAKNDTPVAEPKLTISGSLKLQTDTTLCPHLVKMFECNKYDIRSCPFKTIVGKNDFYPEQMICRSGYSYKKENPDHKYCFIQECRTLEKGNVVYAYGGPVVYAEYAYSVQQVSGGIMTKYALASCGEESKEFKTSMECKSYMHEMKSI